MNQDFALLVLEDAVKIFVMLRWMDRMGAKPVALPGSTEKTVEGATVKAVG